MESGGLISSIVKTLFPGGTLRSRQAVFQKVQTAGVVTAPTEQIIAMWVSLACGSPMDVLLAAPSAMAWGVTQTPRTVATAERTPQSATPLCVRTM